MSKTDEIITDLKSLNLSSVPDEVVLQLIHKFGKIAIMGVDINKKQFVLRARADREFHNYCYEDDITYIKDATNVQDYNRASFRGQPMFYGGTTTDDEHYCQMLCIYEVSSLLEKDTEDENTHEEYITMGKWRVVKDFTVTAVAHHNEFLEENSHLKNMHEGYLKFIKQYPERMNDFLKIAEYISSEFAKSVSNDERYKYKISAAFAAATLQYGVAGILYPTAKDKGKGFNIALSPQTVDNNLKLERIVVWRLRKRNKNILIEPYLYCDEFQEGSKFKWIDPGMNTPPWLVNLKLSK